MYEGISTRPQACILHFFLLLGSFFVSSTMTTNLLLLPPYFIYGVLSSFCLYHLIYWTAETILIPQTKTKTNSDKNSNENDNNNNSSNKSSSLLQENLLSLQRTNYRQYKSFLSIFPSTVHAIIQSFGIPGYIALGNSMNHNKNKISYYDTKWTSFYQGIFVGYLIGDLFVSTSNTVYIIHHTAAIIAWTISAYLQSMQWQTSILQFCELSTILYNIRRYLLLANYYKRDGTVMNSISIGFVITFAIVRIIPLPMILKELYDTGFVDMKNKDGLIMAYFGLYFTIIHTILQTTWFCMMIQKIVIRLFTVLNNNNKKKKKKKKEE